MGSEDTEAEETDVFEAQSTSSKSHAQLRIEHFLLFRFPNINGDQYFQAQAGGEDRDEETALSEGQSVVDGTTEASDTVAAAASRRLLLDELNWRMKKQQADQSKVHDVEE